MGEYGVDSLGLILRSLERVSKLDLF